MRNKGPRKSECHPSLLGAVLVALLGATGCLASDDGDGQPDGGGRVPTPLLDLGGVDGTIDGDAGTGEDAIWGTTGSLDDLARSNGGFALCGLSDIRTDDLGTRVESTVPEEPWGSTPLSDEAGRCGDDAETTIWRLLNCERLSRDLRPLECDLRLVWISRLHSLDMIERNFFDHTNPDGDEPGDRCDEHGIGFSWVGENIAHYPSLESAHWGWMDSTGHRENMLATEFTHAGTGAIQSGGYMLTQSFIRP